VCLIVPYCLPGGGFADCKKVEFQTKGSFVYAGQRCAKTLGLVEGRQNVNPITCLGAARRECFLLLQYMVVYDFHLLAILTLILRAFADPV
jgi:hypothetical protein